MKSIEGLKSIQQTLADVLGRAITVDGIPGTETRQAFDEICAGADAERHGGARGGRQINERGLSLVKHFEGCQLKAYRDEVGILTIGYGHTGLVHNDGTVFAGRTITQDEADKLLRYDMGVFEKRVESLVSVPLTDDQFAALVSFDFNTGSLHKSTLLKKLNVTDYGGAADEFPKWNKAGGQTLRGLTRRRLSEQRLFRGLADFLVEE